MPLKRKERVLEAVFDGDVAWYDPWSDTTLMLNEDAARVVVLLDGSRDVAEIARELDPAGARRGEVLAAVTELVRELLGRGFLEEGASSDARDQDLP